MSRSAPVKVAFRVRPLSLAEQREERFGCVHANVDRKRVSIRTSEGGVHHIDFDRVFDEKSSQSSVFEKLVSPLVSDFVMGRNCCVLSYGYKGSGKTYTMMGPRDDDDEDQDDDRSDVSSLLSGGVSRAQIDPGSVSENTFYPPNQILAGPNKTALEASDLNEYSGIIPRTAKEIFSLLRKRRRRGTTEKDSPSVKLSFVEVHKEKIIDLLNRRSSDGDVPLSVRSSPDQGVYIESATTITCQSDKDIFAALEKGQAARKERAANLHSSTSRSHSIVIMKIERFSRSRGKVATSNFFLVNLASSGMAKKPQTDAAAKAVRKSFSALQKCLRALAEGGRRSVPYGESILTKVLHDSLVKGSGVAVLITASPLSKDSMETVSSMRFGTCVMGRRDEAAEEPNEKDKHAASEKTAGSKTDLFDPELRGEGQKRGDSGSLTERSHQSIQKSFKELEAAGELLKLLPDTPEGSGRKDPVRELSHVSDLLESAAKRMEADLLDAREELKAQGFQELLSAAEMEKQLLEVTKELQSMKYDGHLASQIQSDLAAAHAEFERLRQSHDDEQKLKRLLEPIEQVESLENANRGRGADYLRQKSGRDRKSSKSREAKRAPATVKLKDEVNEPIPTEMKGGKWASKIGSSAQLERLRSQLAEQKRRNEELEKQNEETDRELERTRKRLEELELRKAALLAEGPDAAATVRTIDMSTGGEIDMENDGAPNYVHIVNQDVESPWGEPHPDIEIGRSPVKVCLRLRPMTRLERNRRSRNCIEVHDGNREFTVDSPIDGEYDFCFDNVFDVDCNQAEVYESVGISIIEHLMAGVNCAIMVYGLSGSGKTHTLAGKLPELREDDSSDSSDEDSSTEANEAPSEEDAGFSPRLIADLFRTMKDAPSSVEFRIICSYVCIYLEKMFDLLDPRFDKNLIVRDAANGIKIEGAVEAYCFTEEDIIHLIRRGAACRKLIGSKLKIDHNRSHSVLLLHIEQRHVQTGSIRRSYLQLAELAGFEVTSKAKGQSVQETKIIHKSFSALGNVIKSLTEGNQYAPYRESKLTSVLKDALGGNCKSTLFITASPSSYNISETINSIRLGQRVRRVTNHARINIDASLEDYRGWVLQSETKLGELSRYVREFTTDLYEASIENPGLKDSFSTAIWQSIEAIAEEEEAMMNPCRKALLIDEPTDEKKTPRWRSFSIELAKRRPSDKALEIMKARDTAESLLTDIQSESVVLRRQNEVLVQEKRKMEEEVNSARRENKKISMQNAELAHKLALAENRCKEAVTFLKYMRTLCWKLQKDTEKDRPIEISEITSSLQGSPDLSGLVDLDSMMLEASFLQTREMDVEQVESDYFDYLQEAGLIIDEEQAAAEEEIDELAGLDDGLLGSQGGEKNRWKKAKSAQYARTARGGVPERFSYDNPINNAPDDGSKENHTTEAASYIGSMFGWGVTSQNPTQVESRDEDQPYGKRNTRRERELLRDIQNMANKCVELQLELHEMKALVDSLTNKTSSIKMKNLTKESTTLAKERDRMMHNAKAATWKLQELHVVNKILSKQSTEHKQQVNFLEDSFQRLQESFRVAIQNGLDADQHLRERVKTLQGIVDSLTGPVRDDDSAASDELSPLNARIHIPIRGKRTETGANNATLVDPSSEESEVQCLILKHRGKRLKKRPSSCCHHTAKHIRKSKKTGTALIGEHRKEMQKRYKEGKELILPLFLDDEESLSSEEVSFDSEPKELHGLVR